MATIKDRIRQFNRAYLNPILGKLAGAQWGSFALVHHRGRVSDRPYQTPIMAFPEDGGFLIALTYGPRVDWYRNLRAQGSGQLDWHRQSFQIEGVEPLEADEALAHFPQPQRAVLSLMKVGHYALLETEPSPMAAQQEATR